MRHILAVANITSLIKNYLHAATKIYTIINIDGISVRQVMDSVKCRHWQQQ